MPVAVGGPPPHERRSGADAAQHARRSVARDSTLARGVAAVVLVRVGQPLARVGQRLPELHLEPFMRTLVSNSMHKCKFSIYDA